MFVFLPIEAVVRKVIGSEKPWKMPITPSLTVNSFWSSLYVMVSEKDYSVKESFSKLVVH